MFGYVLPNRDKLSEDERRRFQSTYCGLCHTLGREYGAAAQMILNYDLTFLALLLQEGEGTTETKRCLPHPLHGRTAMCQSTALDTAAAMSVILTWWQVRDGIRDGGGVKYRAAAAALRSAYEKARLQQPEFDAHTKRQLEELAALEAAQDDTLDRPADTFARLLSGAARVVEDTTKRRVLETFLYHLGRWIYLVDAADDLKKDAESGNYNPIPLRFGLSGGQWTDEAKGRLGETLDASIRTMAAAFELWDFGENAAIIRATVYDGLYAVGAAVLDGTFKKRKNTHKEIENQ